jgi:hypothetical protein
MNNENKFERFLLAMWIGAMIALIGLGIADSSHTSKCHKKYINAYYESGQCMVKYEDGYIPSYEYDILMQYEVTK